MMPHAVIYAPKLRQLPPKINKDSGKAMTLPDFLSGHELPNFHGPFFCPLFFPHKLNNNKGLMVT